MVQGGCGLRCALEAGQSLAVPGDFIGQKLERHKAMQPSVLSLIDHTHAATTELLDDAVVRDGLADHPKKCYGGRGGKSTKAGNFAVSQIGNWRKIAVTLVEPRATTDNPLIPRTF